MSEHVRDGRPSFCFLILHYKNLDETLGCVESIKRLVSYKPYSIVIVDNGSQNGTGEELAKLFDDDSSIHLITSHENLGFARGNNLGISYAVHTLGSDFVCMLNSDTRILQEDFCERLETAYNETGAAVVGPKVVDPDGVVLNPYGLPNVKVLKRNTRSMRSFLFFAKLGIDIAPLQKQIGLLVQRLRGKVEHLSVKFDSEVRHTDVVVAGCCLLFTPVYLARYDNIDDRTFLYHEEDLLYLRVKRAGLIMLYDPSLTILHNSHASTKSVTGDDFAYRKFRATHQLKSRKILLKELESWEAQEGAAHK